MRVNYAIEGEFRWRKNFKRGVHKELTQGGVMTTPHYMAIFPLHSKLCTWKLIRWEKRQYSVMLMLAYLFIGLERRFAC